MYIKMKSTAAGPGFMYLSGKSYDVPDKLAKAFINAKSAFETEEPAAAEIETAEMKPDTSKAVKPAPEKKQRKPRKRKPKK